MTILAFGVVKEIFGSGSIELSPDRGATVDLLKAMLKRQYPALGQLSSFVIAVNGEYAAGDTIVSLTDEVAIIPPVSGG